MLARSYILLGTIYRGPRNTFGEARKYLATALQIDETLAEAHTALAVICLFHDWNWPAVKHELDRALALDPNVLRTRNIYGFYLAAMDRLPEALDNIQRSQELDPLAAPRRNELAMCHNWMRQHDQAIIEARKALALDPNFLLAYGELGLAYTQQAKYEQAIAELHKALDLRKGHPRMLGLLGRAYVAAGKKGEVQKVLEELHGLAKQGRYGSPLALARICAALGQKDQAFEWLRKACDDREAIIIYLKVDPTIENLRSDPRFTQLLKDMGLPP